VDFALTITRSVSAPFKHMHHLPTLRVGHLFLSRNALILPHCPGTNGSHLPLSGRLYQIVNFRTGTESISAGFQQFRSRIACAVLPEPPFHFDTMQHPDRNLIRSPEPSPIPLSERLR